LNHANILTIYEVGQFDDVHFIATEYIDGQTIRELIQRGNLSLGEVFDIAIQFVSGLAAAHAAGIIHRDIKPENIMRRGDGGVKILDFGIAKLLEAASPANTGESMARAETEAGVVLGTMGYMSPEQVRGLPVDERTDIWSSGVVLHELLTQRRPFSGVTHADTVVAILDREPGALFAIANNSQPMLRRIQRLVSKALRKSESERFQTAAEMLAELKAVSRDLETAETGDPGRISSRTRVNEIQENVAAPASANLYRYSLVSAVVLLAVIVVGVLLYQRPSAVNRSIVPPPATTAAPKKSYLQMSAAEQLAFVNEQEQRISAMMGERPVKLNDEALQTIKRHVDRYAARKDSALLKPGEEDLKVIYERAPPYVPLIANAFAARRIPIIVGIYLPMIESAYRPCAENSFGAKGLFQFLPETAEHYGVARADMCDAQKMAPAAAHYIADRMAELGDDSQSMTLVLLSYNSGTDPVLDALRRLRETDANYERNFWTLFANRDKLSEGFRRESAGYVPAFFAAAIVGENPEAFDLPMPALSSLATERPARNP
jgi:serine/threonine protein kinase